MSVRSFSSNLDSAVVALGRPYRLVVPNLFSSRDQFCGGQFSHGPGMGGWFGNGLNCITFIVHFISNLIMPLI